MRMLSLIIPGRSHKQRPRVWVAQRFSAANQDTASQAASAAEVCSSVPPSQYKASRKADSLLLKRSAQLILLALATLLFMGAGDSSARFNSLGHRMMCTCGCGQVLLECNHVGCQSSDKMRNELMASLDRGDNDDLILQGFVQNYGPTVIAAPTAKGFNRVAWIMPFLALLFGMSFVVVVVRKWKNKPAPALADGITIPKAGELDELREKARRETEL